jgi:hypothetical protein
VTVGAWFLGVNLAIFISSRLDLITVNTLCRQESASLLGAPEYRLEHQHELGCIRPERAGVSKAGTETIRPLRVGDAGYLAEERVPPGIAGGTTVLQ